MSTLVSTGGPNGVSTGGILNVRLLERIRLRPNVSAENVAQIQAIRSRADLLLAPAIRPGVINKVINTLGGNFAKLFITALSFTSLPTEYDTTVCTLGEKCMEEQGRLRDLHRRCRAFCRLPSSQPSTPACCAHGSRGGNYDLCGTFWSRVGPG